MLAKYMEKTKMARAITSILERVPAGSDVLADALRLPNESSSHMVEVFPKQLFPCWIPGWMSQHEVLLRAESLFHIPFASKPYWVLKPGVFRACLWCKTQGLGSMIWGTTPLHLREKLHIHEILFDYRLGWGFEWDHISFSLNYLDVAPLSSVMRKLFS